ncbi:MAG: hypothetical protein P8X79_02985 [Reinekea sp.]
MIPICFPKISMNLWVHLQFLKNKSIDSSLLPKNWGEPMGAPAIFEKQIEIKLLHSVSTEGVADSGLN